MRLWDLMMLVDGMALGLVMLLELLGLGGSWGGIVVIGMGVGSWFISIVGRGRNEVGLFEAGIDGGVV